MPKVSELPSATTPLDGDEYLIVVQNGATKKVPASEAGLGGGAGTTPTGTGFRHVTSDVEDATVVSETGTGSVVRATSGALTTPTITSGTFLTMTVFGATPATTGDSRFSSGWSMYWRNSLNNANIQTFGVDTGDVIKIGFGSGYRVEIDAGNDDVMLRGDSVDMRLGGDAQAYRFAGSNLAADRIVTLPQLAGDDTFVFEDHAQTLTAKTLADPTVTGDLTLPNSVTVATGSGAPASTPGDGSVYLRTDGSSSTGIYTRQAGSWSAVGGGGSPGGSDTQVQFNDSSAFGGDAGLTFNKTSNFLTVTGGVVVGSSNVATTGDVRVANGFKLVARNSGNSSDVDCLTLGNTIAIGDVAAADWVALRAYSGGELYMQLGFANRITVAATGIQIGNGGNDFGGGNGVIGIDDCSAAPTTNPTGGAIWYVESGASKARGSGGTVTTFGPADPHCPTCGRDFATEHRNDEMGEHLAVCLPCLIDAVVALGADASKFAIINQRGASKAQWDEHHAKTRNANGRPR